MDEMFRRAGRDYPLDTTGADWEKIAKQLNNEEPEKPVSKGNNRKLLWLLVLLPLSFICTRYFIDNGSPVKTENNDSGKPTSLVTARKTGVPNPNNNNTSRQGSGRNASPDVNKAANELDLVNDKDFSGKGFSAENVKSKRKFGGTNEVSDQSRLMESKMLSKQSFNDDETAFAQRPYSGFPLTSKQYPSLLIPPKWTQRQNITELSSIRKEQQENKKFKRFYAGLMGGIDATTVKFQKIENAGYDLGLLLGYSFNKKWSMETGIFRDKKFYYTDGEYFNTSKIYVPANSKITTVDGNCTMWEVPLSVRYNFKSSASSTWFATAGVSSYIMKGENYKYVYYYAATGQSREWNSSYDNSSSHLISVAQISGGYTHRLGKIGDLRIEPYLKLPLRGVGIGSMPLQSAGVHIGITKRLF